MVWAGLASLFFLFAVCWQQFHIVKQHFGFMMLYKAKNKDRDRHGFSAGPLVVAGFAADTPGNVRAAHPAAVDASRAATGMGAGGGARTVRHSGHGLAATASAKAARRSADELAQAGTAAHRDSAAMAGAAERFALRSGWNPAGGHRAGAVPQLPVPSPDVVPQSQPLYRARSAASATDWRRAWCRTSGSILPSPSD